MAYCRYGRDCDWHIFAYRSKAMMASLADILENEHLAIWHSDYRAEGSGEAKGTLFKFAEVKHMLETGDFSPIKGFTEADRELIADRLTEFVKEAEREHKRDK